MCDAIVWFLAATAAAAIINAVAVVVAFAVTVTAIVWFQGKHVKAMCDRL